MHGNAEPQNGGPPDQGRLQRAHRVALWGMWPVWAVPLLIFFGAFDNGRQATIPIQATDFYAVYAKRAQQGDQRHLKYRGGGALALPLMRMVQHPEISGR